MHVVAAAVLLTCLNAVKPFQTDDPMYLKYGAEFAAHPLKPYDFLFGSPFVHPANEHVDPPVLPYWLGFELKVFGDRPALLKIGLLPFALALSAAVAFLGARLAPSLQIPLLWLAVLSPTILPGFNLMLDVPVLALGLSALVVAIASIACNSYSLAVISGLLLGLAIQTKYTGIIACATILTWCVFNHRVRYGFVIIGIGLGIAVAWECFVASTAGQSHFLLQLHREGGNPIRRMVHLVLPLLSHGAGLSPVIAVLAMVALSWSPVRVLVMSVALIACLVALALTPSQRPLLSADNGRSILTISNLIYAVAALIVWGTFAHVCARLGRRTDSSVTENFINWFLLAWLAIELLGYFALSICPAARRMNGIVLVLTFLAVRLAHLEKIRPRIAALICTCGVGFALLFYITDWLEARAQEIAAHETAQQPTWRQGAGRFWVLSWWGFGYYAEREGLRPLQLNRDMPRPGDLLAVDRGPSSFAQTQKILQLEPIATLIVRDSFPFRTLIGYYHGGTPLENQRDGRSPVTIYRVTAIISPANQ